ncbi:MAG TPA: ATP-dependent DNA helicase [Acidimicrobiia bacterium]|nr:ATP-dependent DNA helicase [Acidimicrobiia bacterium]
MILHPTLEQQAILDAPLGPLRIAAGAGTGKTTTVALFVRHLTQNGGIEPESVLGLTFTNKAAAELADRVRSLLQPVVGPGREAEVHTYHGFAAQVVGEFGALVGIERETGVITPTFSRQLLYEVVQNRQFQHYDPTHVGNIDRIQRLGSALGDHLADASRVAAAAGEDEPWPERLELLAAWADYQAEKRRLGVVDYADLISATVRLLSDHPEIASRVRSRYTVVLLDEYQDTNPAQRIMLQRLFGDGYPVVAVGDTDQTIYEWRGATPHNFDSFTQHFAAPDGSPARERHLTLNRRSDRRIIAAANEIRARIGSPGRPLTPLDDAGEGEVSTRWTSDAMAEADWIADEAFRLHQAGMPWKEMAILFRKNRHIALVHDALTEREIPVEVANLGGLLSVPEIADLRAWMRVLHSPDDGPALLRILMGPRYRLGMGDLIHLTRWARHQRTLTEQEEVEIDHEGAVPHTMLEGIDHLEEIDDLPDRARAALLRFRDEYRHLLETAHSSSLAELSRTILDVTGTWRDVEAMGPAGRLTARLNLYRFLDLADEWSPLEGRPSLPAFLDHLEVMEDNPADELDAARLSGEDAVALMTVHRAKGLEWDAVFLPAIVHSTFPSKSMGFDNPLARPQWLPHEWRRDEPPPIDASMPAKEVDAVLRARHDAQEWRTAYVAVTRARHHLYLSGAHWYGAPEPTLKPSTPSELFTLVRDLPFTQDLGEDEITDRPEVLRAGDRVAAPDPLFEDGWAAALREATADPDVVRARARTLGLDGPVEETEQEFRQRLFDLEALPAAGAEAAPTTSVTGLVTYAACPRRYYWSEVDRLPRRPSAAARRGVDVHRRIELHSLGRLPLFDVDADTYDAVGSHADEGAGARTDPYQSYLASPYAERRPLRVETPFQFRSDSGVGIRGRIDAIYPWDDDGWEIVDFKSGRRRHDPWLTVQLQAYAVATRLVDFGLPPPDRVAVTFLYLGDGADPARTEIDDEWLADAHTTVDQLTKAIAAEEFDPIPSPACRSCEFVRFCPPGRAWLELHP